MPLMLEIDSQFDPAYSVWIIYEQMPIHEQLLVVAPEKSFTTTTPDPRINILTLLADNLVGHKVVSVNSAEGAIHVVIEKICYPYYIVGSFGGFGDDCMVAMFVQILNDNNIPAVLYTHNGELFDVPMSHRMPLNGQLFGFSYVLDTSESYMSFNLKRFAEAFHKPPIRITRNCVPIKMSEYSHSCPTVDVAISSNAYHNNPHPVRVWPHFDELKSQLTSRGISWMELGHNSQCVMGVVKAKLYLGVENGTSHFVSSVAQGKALILQSGYTRKEDWCPYDYETVELILPCKPCHLELLSECPYNHKCMRELSVEMVLQAILRRLGRVS